MKGLDVYEIAIKLIGEIYPCGDGNLDEERFNNQQEVIVLINALLDDIKNNATLSDSNCWSIQKIGEAAEKYLNTIEL